jgi:hypothetical protein
MDTAARNKLVIDNRALVYEVVKRLWGWSIIRNAYGEREDAVRAQPA